MSTLLSIVVVVRSVRSIAVAAVSQSPELVMNSDIESMSHASVSAHDGSSNCCAQLPDEIMK